MHVIATAGHVDHGKSTLVKALTATDPDRLAEERRRGLSIELGYCWTSLPPVGDVAFVDVPGHERFITTMLSGIGPVPAVLFVVAADDPWMPQAAEHLAALDAIGVSHGVLAVTRSDLADPGPALERARFELAHTSLRDAQFCTVSGRTGHGLAELRSHLAEMVRSLPTPDPTADVRLWVDRCFHVRGAGTVVTGTLPAGRVSVDDVLVLGSRTVRVRGVQALGQAATSVVGVARVALNITGEDLAALDRHSVLVTPDAWHFTDVVDVRISGSKPFREQGDLPPMPPERPLLHIGAATVPTHCRRLSDEHARLTCRRTLPLRVGDRAVLRDPGSRQLWGVTVLDPAPPRLQRRGAAHERAGELASVDGRPDLASELARRGLVRISLLDRIGVPVTAVEHVGVAAGDWVISHSRAALVKAQLERLLEEHDRSAPLDPGIPLTAVANRLGLPSVALAGALVESPLRVVNGRVMSAEAASLPPKLERAIAAVREELDRNPFAAPSAARLQELGLDKRAVAAAAKAERLLRIADGIVLLSGADRVAVEWLKELPQPFTVSEARIRLDSTRRVILPLLAHLDRLGYSTRLPDDRRLIEEDA